MKKTIIGNTTLRLLTLVALQEALRLIRSHVRPLAPDPLDVHAAVRVEAPRDGSQEAKGLENAAISVEASRHPERDALDSAVVMDAVGHGAVGVQKVVDHAAAGPDDL